MDALVIVGSGMKREQWSSSLLDPRYVSVHKILGAEEIVLLLKQCWIFFPAFCCGIMMKPYYPVVPRSVGFVAVAKSSGWLG